MGEALWESASPTKDGTGSGRKIRAVLFDLGNTLVHYYEREAFPPILAHSLRACAAIATTETSPRYFHGLSERALLLDREASTHAVRPLRERLYELFPESPASAAALEAAFLAPIFACGRLDPDAHRVLEAVRALGIKTAIVSNTPWGSPARAWREELARHDLDELVDTSVFCEDVGFRKPHAAPFARALELLSVPPSEAVFVGDDPEADGRGAELLGILPWLIEPRSANGSALLTPPRTPGDGFVRLRLEEVPPALTCAQALARDAGTKPNGQ